MRSARRLLWLTLGAAAACGGGAPAPADSDAGPVDAAGPPDAGPADAGAPDATTGPVDCEHLSATPSVTLLPGFVGTEDITFDDAGHVLESDTEHIYKTTRGGQRQTFVANLPFRAGMRMTPAGKLIVNDNTTGTLWRIDADGSRHPLMTGLSYPNGMEIGKDGFVYFTDQTEAKVYRVDPESGAHTVLTTGVSEPNGLTFDPTYRKLYIGSFCGDKQQAIHVLDVGANGQPGALHTFATGVGTGCHDGMGVDACGNVYVADFGNSTVYRVSPDGQTIEPLITSRGSYHANFEWGRGVGGWDARKLYVVSVGEGIKEVDLGVARKDR